MWKIWIMYKRGKWQVAWFDWNSKWGFDPLSSVQMTFGGPGCRLQTCRRWEAQWFDSTFWADILLRPRPPQQSDLSFDVKIILINKVINAKTWKMSPNRGISQKARVRGPTVCAASPELSVRCVLSYSQKMQSSCDRIYLQNRIQSHFVMNGNYLLLDAKS